VVDRLERAALGPVRRAQLDYEGYFFQAGDAAGGSYVGEDATSERAEPALFDRDVEDDFDAPPEFDAPTDSEPPTEIATRHALEPETDPGVREAGRHHEIAEEWETNRRHAEEEAGPGSTHPDTGIETRRPDPDAEAQAKPPPASAPSPADEQLPSRHADPDLVEQETAEYNVEEEEPGREDMLEETPEFLQDTPDHDRLWFEQRPPKDFDLGG
jgi:hypothetical protein